MSAPPPPELSLSRDFLTPPGPTVAERDFCLDASSALWLAVQRGHHVPVISEGYVIPEAGPLLAVLVPASEYRRLAALDSVRCCRGCRTAPATPPA